MERNVVDPRTCGCTLALRVSGPGLSDSRQRTRDYLEEVAVDYARGLANKTVTPPIKRLSWLESKF